VLPAVGSRGVILNWSDRKQWSYSLPVVLFRFFAGTREFNPLAIVFGHLSSRNPRPARATHKKLHDMPQTQPSCCGATLLRLPEP
jgi:hypothetical protein